MVKISGSIKTKKLSTLEMKYLVGMYMLITQNIDSKLVARLLKIDRKTLLRKCTINLTEIKEEFQNELAKAEGRKIPN